MVELRKALLRPLDDLLAVTREFLCKDVSRSGLDRRTRRHGVNNLHTLRPAASKDASQGVEGLRAGLPVTCTWI